MALQPLDRPAGSSHVLRFRGVVSSLTAFATYPKSNGTYSTNVIGGTSLVVARFLLGDVSAPATTLLNREKRLPEFVYDDNEPAGSHPVVPTASGVAATATEILNATDLNISGRTWCQNLYVTVTPRTSAAAAALLAVDPGLTRVCTDGNAASGLGGSTGLPVVVMAFVINEQAIPASLDLDVLFEVRDSVAR